MIRIVQLGSPRAKKEGLRLGTVRRPPRGVPKSEFSRRNFYDVWMPILSPSPELVKKGLHAVTPKEWRSFERNYRAQMKRPDASHVLDLLAAMSHETNFSVGCYCENEERCHRSILRDILKERKADVY
ncbi:DUF488 domain-containing protein [Peredibacter starrii]|uniref:DUF488 family protein n=1 Tax=Peredibacter starrii TaxID=28202 RepID=A0AAX4HT41_9BACT|nr:DUF488 family protein [Peredibacter starrii]WPU66568.1 DUF488 family protein [Peredibacter starrii]